MTELKEYSGPYDSNLKFGDFSKEVLVELLEEFRSLFLIIDGMYQTEVATRHSIEEAMEVAEKVWIAYGAREQKRIRKILNIQGNDVETFHKLLQFAPSGSGAAYDFEVEIKDRNHSIMTLPRCKNLEWTEQNDPDRVVPLCHGAEVAIISEYVRLVNPKIKTIPLKLPPRKSPDETPCCIWEFKLEE